MCGGGGGRGWGVGGVGGVKTIQECFRDAGNIQLQRIKVEKSTRQKWVEMSSIVTVSRIKHDRIT